MTFVSAFTLLLPIVITRTCAHCTQALRGQQPQNPEVRNAKTLAGLCTKAIEVRSLPLK